MGYTMEAILMIWKLLRQWAAEEDFIIKSPEKRRILIDLYETNMTPKVLSDFVAHIERLSSRIIKLAIYKIAHKAEIFGITKLYYFPV